MAEERAGRGNLEELLSKAGLSVEGLRRLAATCSSGCQSGCSTECSMKCITCYSGGSTGGVIMEPGFGRSEVILTELINRLRAVAGPSAPEK